MERDCKEQKTVYLDHHSTTPLDPKALDAMMPYLTHEFGNASSKSHCYGWRAEHAVEKARKQLAELIGATSREVIFTSGATESNNIAIRGIAAQYGAGEARGHIITSQVEHKCVLETVKYLESKGFQVTYLPVDKTGRVSVDDVAKAIRKDTLLVSVMMANNETGTINPIAEIGKICHEKNVFFHTDAAQAVGKIAVDVEKMHIDLLSLSAHKMYGPKGSGALYVRRKDPRVEMPPLFHGGGQENGMRSGTVNVPGVVGMGAAAEICRGHIDEEAAHLRGLRDQLWTGLKAQIPDIVLNGHLAERLPHSLNVSFPYVESDSLVSTLRDIAISSTSACNSAAAIPSHVLAAMGLPNELIHSSVRFGIGRFNTEQEIVYTIGKVVEAVEKLRKSSPLYQLKSK
jgi:cysteine desulfurase